MATTRGQEVLRFSRVLLACLIAAVPGVLLAGSWPPDDVAGELNLPSSTAGGLEIRVWLGGGVIEPSSLYRIMETNGVVSVERRAWTLIPKDAANLRTVKEAAHEAKEMRRFMTKERCGAAPTETQNYFWCREPLKTLKTPSEWSVLLHDLLPDELWSLPEKIERECGLGRMDGEIVAIEILEGQRHHAISYGNPDFCCPHVACAIANHVRYLVTHEIR